MEKPSTEDLGWFVMSWMLWNPIQIVVVFSSSFGGQRILTVIQRLKSRAGMPPKRLNYNNKKTQKDGRDNGVLKGVKIYEPKEQENRAQTSKTYTM